MVYTEKIKVKGKTYYKIVHAVRNKGKITHRVRYIGKKLPAKNVLNKIKKEFLEEIRSKTCRYFSKEDIEKIENKKGEYSKKIKNMGQLEREKNLNEFMIRFTYDSSKLAGVQVTLRQTSLILKDGIIPENIKSLKTVKELENHEKDFIAITKYKGPLNLGFMKKLHKILFNGIDDTIAGKLRSELKRNVKIAGTSYVPPKWQEIKKELIFFLNWYKLENKKLHPLELAALVHLKLISIQPFVDGNSRLSRLLMNWVLWKKKYPLVDIPVEDLENYYNALDIYQIEKNEKQFVDYVKKKYLKT